MLTLNNLVELEWNNKKQKRDSGAKLGMYVTLEKPVVNVNDVVTGVLYQLKQNPGLGLKWSEDFGRVIVGMHPSRVHVELQSTEDAESKKVIPIETNKVIPISEYMEQCKIGTETIYGGCYALVLNNAPVSIEGFIVQLVHLIDEIIWEEYLKVKNYVNAVNLVIKGGITIKWATPEQIIDYYSNQKYAVRIYGSGAITHCPKLLGAVGKNGNLPKSIDIKSKESKVPESGNLVYKESIEGAVNPTIYITFSKELHAGHGLLLTLADLHRSSFGGDRVIILSNDTCPRVACMLDTLSQRLQIDKDTAAQLLSNNIIDSRSIISAYRARGSNVSTDSLAIVEKGGLLATIESESKVLIESGGFETVEIIRESQYIYNKSAQTQETEWDSYGFQLLRSPKGIKLLKKGGRLTALGKLVSFVQYSKAAHKDRGVFLFDSHATSLDASQTARSLGYNCGQYHGTGLGFNGVSGSGTLGNLPSLEELVVMFGTNLSSTLRYFLLTRYYISNQDARLVANIESCYDFANKNSFIADLRAAEVELQEFSNKIKGILCKLNDNNSIMTESKVNKEKSKTLLEKLPLQLSALRNLKTCDVIARLRKPVPIRENPKFTRIVQKLVTTKRYTLQGARRFVLDNLAKHSITTNIQWATLMKELKIGEYAILPTVEYDVSSKFYKHALQQGYTGNEAISRTLKYLSSDVLLFQLQNLHFLQLQRVLALVNDVDVWGNTDATNAKEIINECLTHLCFTM